ncbi:MAG: putative periplasmic ligand-binding sensor domain [Bryobacterales bacterium]|nr:putative periplasmic ligand-binding sensor domain [Bryobacterales bacterium]
MPGSITAITQTKDGYLWFGTNHGVLRFDGVRFSLFTPVGGDASYFGATIVLTPGMRSPYVNRLLVDRQGRLWVGTYGGGVIQIDNGKVVRTYTQDDGLSSNVITALHEDRDGSIWLGTNDGALQRLDAGMIVTIRPRQVSGSPVVNSITDDFVSGVWVADARGLLSIKGNKTVRYPIRDDTVPGEPLTILAEAKGRFWIGTRVGLYYLDDGHFTKVWPTVPSPENAVYSIAMDRDRGLWLGTARGLQRIRNGAVDSYGAAAGLSSDKVRDILADSAGNIWAGTAGGIDRLSDKPIVSYSTMQGLSSNQVWSVTVDRSGAIWVGTNSGLNRIRGGRIRSYTSEEGLPSGPIGSVLEGPDGAIWFTTVLGLCRLSHGRIAVYVLKDGIANDRVHGFTWRSDGTLVVSASAGLFAYRDGKFVSLVPAPVARSILESRDRTLWLSAHQLIRWRDGKFTAFGQDSDEYEYAYEDRDGTIWAGSYIGGLICVRGDAVTRFAPLGPPFNYSVSYITDDQTGHFWMATPYGLFRVLKADLVEYSEGNAKRVPATLFGKADGLPSFGCNDGEQNSGWKDREGRILIPTGRGVAVLDPRRIVIDRTPPHTLIEEVSVDDKIIDPSSGARLPPDFKRIDFRYTGINLRAPEYVGFRYRLEGFDKNWVDANTNRYVSYTRLRPGTYRFRVLAASNGVWNEPGAAFSFEVLRPFYGTWWFCLTCVAVLASIMAAAHRWRVQNMKTRIEVTSIERMRIAREIHDTLLQGISGASLLLCPMSSKIPDGDTRARFDDVLNGMQRCMTETRIALWDLREPDAGDWVLHLDHYGQALTANGGIRFVFKTSGRQPDLTARVQQHLARIGHEAILNAVKHSGASELKVSLSFGVGSVELTVEDNGGGFDPDNLPARREHWGLSGMRERAMQLGSDITVTSAPGVGTRINLTVSLGKRMKDGNNAGSRRSGALP